VIGANNVISTFNGIQGGTVNINGQQRKATKFEIHIDGEVLEFPIDSKLSIEVHAQEVQQVRNTIGNVTVKGNVGSVNCTNGGVVVEGNVTGGCKTVNGSIKAKSIQGNCSTVHGSISNKF